MNAAPRGMGVALSVLLVAALAGSAQAQPEMHGTHTWTEWDAGRLPFAGTMIRLRVLFPDDAGPFPLIAVVHGATRTGAQQIETARTFASRGFVVLLPDMPCLSVGGCDHDANASQLIAMFDWAVTQNDDAASMIHGRVDGMRRGIVGHSWGALAAHLAAARDPRLSSIVLFDPNDDGTVGRDATAMITGAEMQLLAEVPGNCNSQWNEAMITPRLVAPHVQLTVTGSAHCDPEDPSDALCPAVCGRGDPSTKIYFRRYAVAWTECNLLGNPAVADWIGGAGTSADETAMIIENVVASGLDTLPCRSGVFPDAGVAIDGGGTVDVDAAATESDATAGTDGGVGADAGATVDAGSGRMDAGTATPDAGERAGSTAGSCGCAAPGAHGRHGALALALGLGLALLVRSKRRARS